MKIIAVLLLIIGLAKLYLAITSSKEEIKELFLNVPMSINISPEVVQGLITAEGLICSFGGALILFLI